MVNKCFGRYMIFTVSILQFIAVTVLMISDFIVVSDICYYLDKARYREIMIMIAAFILIPTLKRKVIKLKVISNY
jgi:hypothetical protein